MSVKIYDNDYGGSPYSQDGAMTNPIVLKDPPSGVDQKRLYLRHNQLSGAGAESSYGVSIQAKDIAGPDESSWIQIAPDSSGLPGTYGSGGGSVSLGDVPGGSIVPFWVKSTSASTLYGIKDDIYLQVTATQTKMSKSINFSSGTYTNTVWDGVALKLVSGATSGSWLSDWINIPNSVGLFPATIVTDGGTNSNINYLYRSSSDGTDANASPWTNDPTELSVSHHYFQIKIVWVTSAQDYSDIILADAPVLYYRLGESSGTTMIDKMGHKNGTYIGSPWLSQTAVISNTTNTAVDFHQTGMYGDVPYGQYVSQLGDVTLEWWGKHNLGQRYNVIGTHYTREYQMTLEADGSVAVYHGNGSNYFGGVPIPAGGIVSGQKQHVCLIRNGSNWLGYVNGVLKGTVSWAGSYGPSAGTNDLTIGQGYTGIGGVGILDEVAIYNYALSADQVSKHYQAGK